MDATDLDELECVELVKLVPKSVRDAATAFAHRESREWPYGTYCANDLTLMYKHGYLRGYIEARNAIQAAIAKATGEV